LGARPPYKGEKIMIEILKITSEVVHDSITTSDEDHAITIWKIVIAEITNTLIDEDEDLKRWLKNDHNK
jgi:hypothetical protein